MIGTLAGGRERANSQFDPVPRPYSPPFAARLWEAAAAALQPRLADRAWIYVELGAGTAFDAPPGWRLHRQAGSREARNLLYLSEKRDPAATLADSFPGTGSVSS